MGVENIEAEWYLPRLQFTQTASPSLERDAEVSQLQNFLQQKTVRRTLGCTTSGFGPHIRD